MSTVSTAYPFMRGGKHMAVVAVALLALTLALVGFWLWSGRAERDAISELDPGERRALYERTLENLQTTCAPAERPKGLDDYCRRQAKFILKFPECDGACADLAREQATQPSR